MHLEMNCVFTSEHMHRSQSTYMQEKKKKTNKREYLEKNKGKGTRAFRKYSRHQAIWRNKGKAVEILRQKSWFFKL